MRTFFPIFVIIVVVVIDIIVLFLRRNTLSMVLKKFSLNHDLSDGNLVTIIGRKSGLLSWLLTLIRLSPEVSFIVTAKDLRFNKKSLFGEKNIVMTLRNVSHVNCAYSKPFWYLVLAILSLISFSLSLSEDFDYSTTFFIVSIILFLIFYFNKSITIVIETVGGATYKVKFKPSFIENVDVNLDKAKEVVELINSQIIKEQERFYK